MHQTPLFPVGTRHLIPIIALMLLSSCSKNPAVGPSHRTLAPCPSSPNCVASDSQDKGHAIAPLRLISTGGESWRQVRSVVLSLPHTRPIVERENYLQVECRSAVFGFVDDLELQLRPNEGVVAVRSTSRIGYYDFGVNRRRIEKLRSLLQVRRLVQ
jgi:uncharacterized protein (DUF1499 family)